MQETPVRSLGWEDPWKRESLPTPVFCPGEFHGGYSLWGCKELDTTKRLSIHTHREENQILEHLRWAELQNSEPDLVNNLHSPVG